LASHGDRIAQSRVTLRGAHGDEYFERAMSSARGRSPDQVHDLAIGGTSHVESMQTRDSFLCGAWSPMSSQVTTARYLGDVAHSTSIQKLHKATSGGVSTRVCNAWAGPATREVGRFLMERLPSTTVPPTPREVRISAGARAPGRPLPFWLLGISDVSVRRRERTNHTATSSLSN